MDIKKSILDAYNIYRGANFPMILFASILTIIIPRIPVLLFLSPVLDSSRDNQMINMLAIHVIPGLLILPLYVGIQMLFVRIKRGNKISVSDIFEPYNNIYIILTGAGYSILHYYYPNLGLLLLCFFSPWWIFSLLTIHDKRLGILDSLRASQKLITRANILKLVGLICIFFGILLISSLLRYRTVLISEILIAPMAWGIIACAYANEVK